MTALTTGNQASGIVPATFEDVQRVAKALVAAGMGSFPWNADDDQKHAIVTAQIMCGLELGVPPMQAMANIAIINGRPQVWGELAIGLVLARGFQYGLDFVGEGDERKAVAWIIRPGRTDKITATFSVAQAKQARLWDEREKVQKRGKNNSTYTADNDSPWFKYSDDMLGWKATARAMKRGAADVLKGVALREDMEHPEQEPIDITPEQTVVPDIPDIPEETESVIDAEAVEPLADEEGLVRQIEDDIAATGNVPEFLNEVEEQYAELIPRLSECGRVTVEELFESARA